MKPKCLCIIIALGVLIGAHSASAIIYNFSIDLSGANEVGSTGDPDGSGSASLYFDSVASTISWNIEVFDIAEIVGAHIHNAPAGVNGPVLVNFSGSLTGSNLFDSDITSILAAPTDYYVNVHTTEHPGGAVRGQLGEARAVPDSLATYMAWLPIGLMLLLRTRLGRSARSLS